MEPAWPRGQPEYLRFVLVKQNMVRLPCLVSAVLLLVFLGSVLKPILFLLCGGCVLVLLLQDTLAAVAELSRRLRMSQDKFAFAGTKDKRGVTCQELTCHRVSAVLFPCS